MPQYDTLSEVIVYVQDMERMLSFYTDAFGLEVTTGQPEHGFVKLDVGSAELCLHAGGEGDIGSDAPKIVFDVEDLGEARSHLEGFDVELGDVRNPAPDVYVVDGRDPEGNKFSVEASSPPE